MGLPTPDSLVSPFGNCLKKSFNSPQFSFPQIGDPGMPPILMGAIGAMLGPAAPVLNFIPPNVDIVPDIKDLLTNLPSIVIKGFTDAAKGLPALSFEVAGVKVAIPGVDVPNFDPKNIINLIKGLILAPINIFTDILNSLISLQPKFPTLDGIIDILVDALKSVGFSVDIAKGFTTCLATSFMEVVKAIMP